VSGILGVVIVALSVYVTAYPGVAIVLGAIVAFFSAFFALPLALLAVSTGEQPPVERSPSSRIGAGRTETLSPPEVEP
jgi:hypothetical protein